MCVCVQTCVCMCAQGHVHVCVNSRTCVYVWACTCVCIYTCECVCVPDPASQRQARVIPSPASAKWPQASLGLPCQSHSISRGDASPGWRSRLRVLLNTQIVPGLFLVLADSRGGKWILPLLRNSKFVPSSVTTGKSKCCKGLQNNLQSWTELGVL